MRILSLEFVAFVVVLGFFYTGCSDEQVVSCRDDRDCGAVGHCVAGQCRWERRDGGVVKESLSSEEWEKRNKDEDVTRDVIRERKQVRDEGHAVQCRNGETRSCYTGPEGTLGRKPCRAGIQRCVNGHWEARCQGEILPPLERCNGKDDDCDGQIDESFPENVCTKGRAKGPCRQGKPICKGGMLYCEAIYKARSEICGNGIDDDCDGIVDGPPCACPAGKKRACYTGATGCVYNAGIYRCHGRCRAGIQICDASGKAGSCQGQILPIAEVCNGKDDDCDGIADETFPQKGKACQVVGRLGECSKGKYACVKGHLICQGSQPISEICGDKKDNDCDGAIDEGCSSSGCHVGSKRACYSGPKGTNHVGVCIEGVQICQKNGRWSSCQGEVLPAKEICDNKDNDCDGIIDDGGVCFICKPGQKRSCYTGNPKTRHVGNCRDGIHLCQSNGQWPSHYCPNEVLPTKEVCNGKDDDCDGLTDEEGVCVQCKPGQKRSCYSGRKGSLGVGICRAGYQYCSSRGKWLTRCVGEVTPTFEVCNGKDDDCDGTTDEGGVCGACRPGAKRSCYGGRKGSQGVGICKAGIQVCSKSRQWGPCQGEIRPQVERCDGKDNDCDGAVDESFIGKGRPCQTHGTGKGACAYGSSQCSNGRIICVANRPASYDKCGDKIDNDCDGAVDESCGMAYNYALIRHDGLIRFQRGVRTPTTPQGQPVNPRSSKGVYRLFLKGVHAYQYGVPIVVPLSRQVRLISWSRGGLPSLNYEMLAFWARDINGHLVDTSFAVVAAKGGVYARITAGGAATHVYPNSSAVSVKRVAVGRYLVKTKAFQSISTTPVLLSFMGESNFGYVTYKAVSTSGAFEIQVRDGHGRLMDNSCAFWLPDPQNSIWAIMRLRKLVRQGPESRQKITFSSGSSLHVAPANYRFGHTAAFFSLESSSFATATGLDENNRFRLFQFSLTPQGSTAKAQPNLSQGYSFLFVN